MKLTASQLNDLVRVARSQGRQQVITEMPDGTVIEIRLAPPKQHPLALLMERLKNQQPKPQTN